MSKTNVREIFDLIDKATTTYVNSDDKFLGDMHKFGIVDREKLIGLFDKYLKEKVEQKAKDIISEYRFGSMPEEGVDKFVEDIAYEKERRARKNG